MYKTMRDVALTIQLEHQGAVPYPITEQQSWVNDTTPLYIERFPTNKKPD